MSLLDNFWVSTLRDTVTNWLEDKAFRLGAALAFFSMFSIAPLLLIVVSLMGLFFGRTEARAELEEELGNFLSPEAAETLLNLADHAQRTGDSLWATIAGIVALVFGATGVFGQLQDALNSIWGVKAKPKKSWLHMIRKRLLSFSMVLVIGFLLLVSLALSTLLSSLTGLASDYFNLPSWTVSGLDLGVSFLVVAILFAFIFKVLPDAKVRWRDVRLGALVTAGLFVLGKFFLAWYLGRESTTSAYGAAGAFVLVLLWIYYSSLILFLGAEFTQAYVRNSGDTIEPSRHAVKVKTTELEGI
ncbi:MAG: YihY/virulence factor BrkB family protein [Verrucomicrobiales bacterium]